MNRAVLVTPPAVEPVSLFSAQEHLRLEPDISDTYVPGLIAAARSWVEQHLGRALVQQKWRLALDAFLRSPVYLPRPPFVSIDAVTYFDAAGAVQPLAPSAYVVAAADEALFSLAPGATWPSTQARPGAVQIDYLAGYTDAAVEGDPDNEIPAAIKHAILLLVGHLHENREPEITGTITSRFSFAVESLLSPYRVERW